VLAPKDGALATARATLTDLSLSGAMLRFESDLPIETGLDQWLVLDIGGVGRIPGQVRRLASRPGGLVLGLQFDLPVSRRRDALIEKIFTEGRDNSTHAHDTWAVTWRMILRVFRSDVVRPRQTHVNAKAPTFVASLCHDEIGANVVHVENWAAKHSNAVWVPRAA
jgi:hypothetical protein